MQFFFVSEHIKGLWFFIGYSIARLGDRQYIIWPKNRGGVGIQRLSENSLFLNSRDRMGVLLGLGISEFMQSCGA